MHGLTRNAALKTMQFGICKEMIDIDDASILAILRLFDEISSKLYNNRRFIHAFYQISIQTRYSVQCSVRHDKKNISYADIFVKI